MTRILAAGISQETNTFSNIPTSLAEFEKQGLYRGPAVADAMAGTGSVIGGFIDAARRHHWELITALRSYALPGGIVAKGALEELLAGVLQTIDGAGELDGILLELHGATVAEHQDDATGYILERVRERAGPGIPVVSTLDLHANVTPRIVRDADAVCGYDTYPHIDFYDRGCEAGEMMARILAGELRPTMAMAQAPLLPPLQKMVTSTPGNAMARMMEIAREIERDPQVVDVSVFGGFPYADVRDAGFSAVVVTNGNLDLAQRLAARICEQSWEWREEWLVHPTPPAEAIAEAMAAGGGTFILADIADSGGGGTAGDGTEVLRALLAARAKGAAVAQIADAQAVQRCIEAGIGSTVTMEIGGKHDQLHGRPVEVTGYVRLISDGTFVRGGSWQPGVKQVMGTTVVLDCNATGTPGDGIEVLLTSFRTHPTNLEHFRSQGIEPTQRRILVLKGAAHYRAEFEPIARKVIEVDAPGITHPDLTRFDFKKVRRPIYPLDSADVIAARA